LTDLNAEGETLPLSPPREDWLGHKGMVQAAQYILGEAPRRTVDREALQHCPERGTPDFQIVIVGPLSWGRHCKHPRHSVATVLCFFEVLLLLAARWFAQLARCGVHQSLHRVCGGGKRCGTQNRTQSNGSSQS
jgi:hypothetical protein